MNIHNSLTESLSDLKLTFTKLFFVTLSLVFYFACTPNPQDTQELQGNWIVVAAERGGRPTTTLKDAYFNFVGDSLLRTNLFQEDGEFEYKYTGSQIFQSEETETITYNVEHFNRDTLVLDAIIKNYNFKFLLLRDTTATSLQL